MSHNHNNGDMWVPISSGFSGAIWFGSPQGPLEARGNIGGASYGWVVGPARGTLPEEKATIKEGTAVKGSTGEANPTLTQPASPGTDFQLSGVTDIRPAFREMFFIIRVK